MWHCFCKGFIWLANVWGLMYLMYFTCGFPRQVGRLDILKAILLFYLSPFTTVFLTLITFIKLSCIQWPFWLPFRSINYDEKDPFLCNACGFCKYARFDFMLYAKPCCAVDPIENEEDRKKVSLIAESLMECSVSWLGQQPSRDIRGSSLLGVTWKACSFEPSHWLMRSLFTVLPHQISDSSKDIIQCFTYKLAVWHLFTLLYNLGCTVCFTILCEEPC